MTKTLHAIKNIILATIPVSGTKCAMNANSTQSTQVRKIPRATKSIILLSSYNRSDSVLVTHGPFEDLIYIGSTGSRTQVSGIRIHCDNQLHYASVVT